MTELDNGVLSPRERLLMAQSVETISDEDLLAILLGTGIHGCDVVELSHRLSLSLRRILDNPNAASDWRSLDAAINSYNEANPLRPVRGLGKVKLLKLAAAFELANRRYRHYEDDLLDRVILRSSQAAFKLFERAMARHPEQEHFFVVPMDSCSHPLCAPIIIAKGGVGSVSVHPREVFCEAIRWRAYAVIVAHNHPSGDPTPSLQDIQLTKALVEASKLVHIPLIDHLVITKDGFVSIRTHGAVTFT